MTEVTRGIVLNYTKYSDSSGIVNLFTQHAGRQAYMVRGVNKGRKVMRGALFQPLMILDIEASHNQKREVQQMKSCTLGYVPASTPYDILKSSVAMFIAEVLTSALREEGCDERLYRFLEDSVIYLDQATVGIANFHIMFLVRLSSFLGFGPSLPDSGEMPVFDLTNGIFGMVPPVSGEYASQVNSSVLRSFLATPFSEMSSIKLDRDERSELVDLLLKYYTLHIPGFSRINSARILHDVFG
jgi:DNA repair protein RecO (recombination protein O)